MHSSDLLLLMLSRTCALAHAFKTLKTSPSLLLHLCVLFLSPFFTPSPLLSPPPLPPEPKLRPQQNMVRGVGRGREVLRPLLPRPGVAHKVTPGHRHHVAVTRDPQQPGRLQPRRVEHVVHLVLGVGHQAGVLLVEERHGGVVAVDLP